MKHLVALIALIVVGLSVGVLTASAGTTGTTPEPTVVCLALDCPPAVVVTNPLSPPFFPINVSVPTTTTVPEAVPVSEQPEQVVVVPRFTG